MVVQRRQSSVAAVAQASTEFLKFWNAEAEAKSSKNKERDKISKYFVPDEKKIDAHDVNAGNPNKVEVDAETGHRYWRFDKPIQVGKKIITALQFQRKVVGPYMDLEAIEEWFLRPKDVTPSEKKRRLALWNQVHHPVTEHVTDFDVIHRLQQRGELTQADLESFMTTSISWALYAVKE